MLANRAAEARNSASLTNEYAALDGLWACLTGMLSNEDAGNFVSVEPGASVQKEAPASE